MGMQKIERISFKKVHATAHTEKNNVTESVSTHLMLQYRNYELELRRAIREEIWFSEK
jgi:hypothetical protein